MAERMTFNYMFCPHHGDILWGLVQCTLLDLCGLTKEEVRVVCVCVCVCVCARLLDSFECSLLEICYACASSSGGLGRNTSQKLLLKL